MAISLAPYGITIGSKTGTFNMQAIKDMQDLAGGRKNALCLRYQVPMSVVAPAIGQYNWKPYDPVVQACYDAGIQVYLTIKKFPESGNPTPAEATAFAMAIAQRYGDKVAAIEGGNEDFRYSEFSQMADVMIAMYTSVKAINPNILVLPGSTLQRNSRDMKAAMTTFLQKAGKHTDGMNIHTYFGIPGTGPSVPQDGSVSNVPSFPQYVQNMKDVCKATGYPDMAIYDTEFGFSCTKVNHENVPTFNEQNQATHMLFCLDEARRAGVKHMSWFTLGYANPPDGMSLVQANGRKTPAYIALKEYIAKYPTWDSTTPTPDPTPIPEPEPEPTPNPDLPPTPVPGPTALQITEALAQLDQAAIHRKAASAALTSADECLTKAVALLKPTQS